MGTVFKKTFTKPLPPNAEILEKDGERLARWKPEKGRLRMAPITTGNEGTDRILIKAATYTAKYRDGQGRVVERPTGCRDETAARSVLAELEKRAELVKAKVLSTTQDSVADHQNRPLADHFADYLAHLKAKRLSDSHRDDQERYLRRVARDCRFLKLLDLDRSALEHWLLRHTEAGMSARSFNPYRAAAVGFCNWCVETRRLMSNPFATIVTLNVKTDPRRKRRALTEEELLKLIEVARKRPLLDALRISRGARKGEARANLRPETQKRLEALGHERALIYKTLVLTGLRRGELASLTVGQLELSLPGKVCQTEKSKSSWRKNTATPSIEDCGPNNSPYWSEGDNGRRANP